MNFILLNSIPVLVSWCYLVCSHLMTSSCFTFLSSSSDKDSFLLSKRVVYIWAWISLCSQPIWTLWYAVCSITKTVSQTLYSHCSGFPEHFSLSLPDAVLFWVWLEDSISSTFGSLLPTAVIWSHFPPPFFFSSSLFQFWSSSRVSLSDWFVLVDL